MRVWSKRHPSGKLIELKIDGPGINVVVDGKSQGITQTVVRLDETARRGYYKHAPRVNSQGEAITHAVHIVMLTRAEGEAVEAMHAEETAADRERRDRAEQEKYAAQWERARATGRPVVVETWTDECNDRREECSLDHVSRSIRPDGAFVITRRHTW
jgi:hypothetical protein